MQVKKQQLEPDMEEQTVSKLEKECAEYIMWNTSWNQDGWEK